MTAQDDARRQRLEYAEQVKLGEECARFLESEEVAKFLAHAERAWMDQLRSLAVDADVPRYRACVALGLIDDMRKSFAKWAEQGAYSEKLLRQMTDKEDGEDA